MSFHLPTNLLLACPHHSPITSTLPSYILFPIPTCVLCACVILPLSLPPSLLLFHLHLHLLFSILPPTPACGFHLQSSSLIRRSFWCSSTQHIKVIAAQDVRTHADRFNLL